MIWDRNLLVFAVAIGLLTSSAIADNHIRKSQWVALGIGVSHEGPAVGAGYSRLMFGGVGTLRFGAIPDVIITADPNESSYESNLESAAMFGVLFGPKFEGRRMNLSVAVGPAWTWVNVMRYIGLSSREEEHSLPSIALDLQTFITAYRALGFGLIGFGNINEEASYFGILACFQLR